VIGRTVVLLFVLLPAAVASERQPPPAEALQEARSLLDRGDLDDAERLVRGRLQAQPSADAHFLLGHILFRRVQAQAALEGPGGAHSEATREGARAALRAYADGARERDLGPEDLKIAALAQLLLRDYVSADRLLTWAVEADAKDPQAWYYLGRTKYNENRFVEAIAAFEQCLKLEPANVKAHDNLGLSYAGLGRVDEALAAYREAIAAQANVAAPDAGPFLNLGSLLLEQNQPREALPPLTRAAALAPRLPAARERLGKAHLQLGDVDLALPELEAAVTLDPESAPLRFLLGQAYRKKGLMEKARAELARAAELNEKRRP
jgi:tetratricopeptide (TPR) repeat protein